MHGKLPLKLSVQKVILVSPHLQWHLHPMLLVTNGSPWPSCISNWLSSTGNSFLRLQTLFWSIPAPGSVRSNFQFFLLKSCVCMLSRFLLSLILCNPMDCSPSGSSVHGVLEWVAMPSSRGPSWTRDWTRGVSYIFCITGGFFMLNHLGSPIYNGVYMLISISQFIPPFFHTTS